MLCFKPRRNGRGAYLTWQCRPGLQVLPAEHPSVPSCYRVLLVYPTFYPDLCSPEAELPVHPEALPYIIQTFWLPNCFVLLFSWFLSPISSLISLSWPSSVWSCLLWILPNVPASTFSLLSTINVRSPPPHLRAPLSFPFLFIRFHLFTDNMARPRLQNTNSWSCVWLSDPLVLNDQTKYGTTCLSITLVSFLLPGGFPAWARPEPALRDPPHEQTVLQPTILCSSRPSGCPLIPPFHSHFLFIPHSESSPCPPPTFLLCVCILRQVIVECLLLSHSVLFFWNRVLDWIGSSLLTRLASLWAPRTCLSPSLL
jgi:hypothetical protein